VSLIEAGVKIGDAQQEGEAPTWMLDDPEALQAELDAVAALKQQKVFRT
jgi:hypothetical protein